MQNCIELYILYIVSKNLIIHIEHLYIYNPQNRPIYYYTIYIMNPSAHHIYTKKCTYMKLIIKYKIVDFSDLAT